MPDAEKLVIKKRDKDLCRIIPFNPIEDNYEFKISILGNRYDIAIHKLFEATPSICTLYNSEHIEITYHRKNETNPTKIQLKGNQKLPDGSEWHQPLPLTRLVDPSPMDLFPVPLIKMEFPDKEIYKKYNSKIKRRQIIDMENNNTVELFLCHKDFDYERFSQAFANMALVSLIFPLEYYATNSILAPSFKMSDYSIERDKPLVTFFPLNNDMNIMCKHYINPDVDKKLNQARITFIENEMFFHVLAMTQIKHPSPINGEYPNIYMANARKENLPDNAALFIDVPKDCIMYHDIMRQHLCEDEENEEFKLCTRLKRELLYEIKNFESQQASEIKL